MHRAGVTATGEVVDADPLGRVQALLAAEQFDAVVVCTLPRRLSRWLVMDLPHRIARLSAVPVIHVEGTAGPSL
jgi:nucleotide-binding universal stress UspA family protein